MSNATTLVPGDLDTDSASVFVRDRILGITERVGVAGRGGQANDDCGTDVAISADGRFVAF